MSITTRAPYGAELEYMPSEAFKLNPIARAFGEQPNLHGGGGGAKGAVKKIATVAVAVAIPYAAPIVASSIGLSAAIGATAGAAVTGAAMGAGLAKATGGNVGQGALMGGIGGGISGYASAPTPTPTAPTITQQAAMGGYGGGGYGTVATGGMTIPGVAPTTAGLTVAPETLGQTYGTMGAQQAGISPGYSPTFTTAPTQTFANIAGTDVNAGIGAYGTAPAAAPVAAGINQGQIAAYGTLGPQAAAAAPEFSYAGLGAAPTAAPTAAGTTAGATGAAGAQPRTFMEALGQVPANIKARFSDPKVLADLTLKAAGQLAGSYAAGPGMTAEEQKLLDAQVQELKDLQQNNQALFNQRLEQAQGLIGESKYFDPEYFGLQRARKAQVAAGRAKRAGLRGLTGAAREAESRRFDLAAGRDVGTAYDVGYGQGVSGRLQTQQAGLSAMPTAYPTSGSEFANIGRAYEAASSRRRQTTGDIGDLFGSFTGASKATSRG